MSSTARGERKRAGGETMPGTARGAGVADETILWEKTRYE